MFFPADLRRFLAPAALSIILVVGAVGCSVAASPSTGASNGTATGVPASAAGTAQNGSSQAVTSGNSSSQTNTAPSSFASAISHVAQSVRPAIVQITSTQQSLSGFGQTVPQTGVGSGVIYDSQGHILTNDHVVAGATSLTVSLPDGRSFDAKIVGEDPQTDLAVVQIQGTNLPVAQLGDSSKLAVGDWVVAIGNALALPGGPTVTQGVVSALNRTVQEPPSQTTGQAGPFLYDVIQTDASINPGNSGGALVNLQGQVIGINTLIAGAAEPGVQAQGIGFAIAINTAKPIADQLVATGKVVHPFIGIAYTDLTPSLARQLAVPAGTKGIVVAQVVSGSPAAQSGLKQGDVITQVDGHPITSDSTLGKYLLDKKPGDVITLTVQRGSNSSQVKITLGVVPSGS